MAVTHAFVSAVPDSGDPDEVSSSEWNAAHDVDLDAADVGAEPAGTVAAHEAAGNPHPTYETSAEAQAKVDTHAGAADPHTGYQKESEKGAPSGYASLGADGLVPDSELPDPPGSGAHDASAISFTPAGTIAATNVQAAIEEVATEGGGGGGGGAPTDAQYVTLAANGTLTDERVLTPGIGLDLTDAGAGAAATLDVDPSEIAAVAGSGVPIVKRKSANETVNNSVTLQNDDHLFWSAAANEVWFFRAMLLVNAASASMDVKFQWTFPAGTTMLWGGEGIGSDAGTGWGSRAVGQSVVALATESANQNFGTLAGTTGVALDGMVRVGGTPGTIQLQWAQATAEAADLILLQDSIVLAYRIA